MTEADKKRAAKAFAEYWKDRGDEKAIANPFGLRLSVTFSVSQRPSSARHTKPTTVP